MWYQGVEGAYSHAAALQYFGDDADVYHVPSFEDAMVEVKKAGRITQSYPLRIPPQGLSAATMIIWSCITCIIVAETQVSVNHAFWDLKGAVLSDIKGCIPIPRR